MKHAGQLELTWTNKEKALLSTGDGRYDYTFVDPADYRVNEVRLLHEVGRYDAEVPSDRPDALPAPTADNLLITGDAMHVLDALRMIPQYADKYLGQIKLCYIDPPFNTGQAFTHYEDNIEHSIWLTMLRDRLNQIKPLLSDDGSVWVHLDEVESSHCRLVLDETFGSSCFAGELIWRSTDNSNNDAKAFSSDHNTVLVYSKSENWISNRLSDDGEKSAHYKNPDNDPRGPWFDGNPLGSPNPRENLRFDLTSPQGHVITPPPNGWRWSRKTLQGKLDSGEIRFTPDGKGIRRRTYLWEQNGLPPSSLWSDIDRTGSNRRAKSQIKRLFPGKPTAELFPTPKPEDLLQRIIEVGTNPGDIVLDCFAGSGTTAAVAQKMGRRWVTSELSTENVETFTKPRLLKVINGEDSGGISTVTERVVVDGVELPNGVTPEQAQSFTTLVKKFGDELEVPLDVAKQTAKAVRAQGKDGMSPLSDEEQKMLIRLLNKISKSEDEGLLVNVMPDAVKALRAAAKTRDETTVNWHGGGGFTHLRVGSSMFEASGKRVYLAEWATNGALTDAMCAQLGVRHQPDGIFAGSKGKVRYVILDGMVNASTVAAILDQLPDGNIVEVWATQTDPAAAETLRKARPGSRLSSIPASVLDSYRNKAAQGSPFKRAETTGK